MRINFDDLRKYGLYDNLPKELKELEDSEANYFIFYYSVNEKELKLNIYEANNVKEINVSLYRGISSIARKYKTNLIDLAFFSKTFETKDGIFYQFLRTYNDSEKVKNLYDYAIKKDREIEASISTNAITHILNSDSFRRAISYFSPNRLQSIMSVYDLVDDAISKRFAKRLYGDFLKKVVTIVRYDGGILPEIGGEIRFMVIGENAELSEEQKTNLEEAKALLRSYVPKDVIYQQTGWVYADWDGKWRTNITDDEAKLVDTLFYDYNGRKLYVPKDTEKSTVISLLDNPSNLYKYFYKGKLVDILQHSKLYEHYPQLALLPVIYYFGESKSGHKPSFYYNATSRGGYIVICGYPECGDSLSILLHEIQHAIQEKEKFSRGGNEFLASFVVALGGQEVRKIFTSINKIEKYFNDYLNNDTSRLEIKNKLELEIENTNEAKQIKKELLKYLESYEVYKESISSINFYLIIFIAENGDFSTNSLTTFLVEKFGYIIYEIFGNITEAYNEAKKYKQKLSSEGYRQEDIDRILFSSYQNLYGETESRATQSSRYLGSEYKNYFYLNGWENGVLTNIVVIDGKEELLNSKEIVAAVETKNDEYVLHFEKNRSCEPFLHELGHIVFDCLIKLGHKEKISNIYKDADTYQDINELFVDNFLGYIKENIEDNNISTDLKFNFKIKNNVEIAKILDEFFRDSEINERTKFVKYMLEII